MSDTVYPDEMKILLPDSYLMAIGKVCEAWGSLEGIVDLAICKLAEFDLGDPRGTIITTHMTWPLKMDVIESLISALRTDYPHLRKFEKAKPLLKQAQQGRNKVVHGQWHYENDRVYKLRATARGQLKATVDPITVNEIEAIARNIGRASAATLKAVLNK